MEHFPSKYPPDKASRRTFSWLDLVKTKLRLIGKRGITCGKSVVVGRRVEFIMTDNAILEIGDNNRIDSYVQFVMTRPSPHIVLGEHVLLGRYSIIACKQSVEIGDHTRIGTGTIIRDNTHLFRKGKVLMDVETDIKPVKIGKRVWIGDRSIIFPGVTIGDGAVISANSMVTSDVEPETIVAGQPARFIKDVPD